MTKFMRGLIVGIALVVTAQISIATPFTLMPVGPTRTDGFHIATGLNDAGFVAGTTNEGDGSSDAFLWNSQTQSYVPLGPVPPPYVSRGVNAQDNKINNSNQITGTLSGAGPNLPYVWQSGVTSALPLLPNAVSGVAESIGDGGHVVGYNTVNGVSLPFIHSGLGLTQLALLPGMDRGNAVDVNLQGDAVGYQQNNGQTQTLGVAWIGGNAIDLGFAEGVGLAINNSGTVAGLRMESSNGNDRIFVLWQNGQVTDLFAAQGGAVYGMNDLGSVVGTVLFGGNQFAFLWDPVAGLLNLNDQIDPLSGWELTEAHAINELGQIVGRGTNALGIEQGFLLTRTGESFVTGPGIPGGQIPEPPTLALLALGLLAVASVRRRPNSCIVR